MKKKRKRQNKKRKFKKKQKAPKITLQGASDTKEEVKRIKSTNPFDLFQYKVPNKKKSESSVDKYSSANKSKRLQKSTINLANK